MVAREKKKKKKSDVRIVAGRREGEKPGLQAIWAGGSCSAEADSKADDDV